MDELRFFDVCRVSTGFQTAYLENPGEKDSRNNAAVLIRRSLTRDQVLCELEFTRARLLEASRSATARGLDESLYAEVSLEGGAHHEVAHAATIRQIRAAGP